jgi:putative ABC transport system permease protein
MTLLDLTQEIHEALTANKVRSSLTMLGIVIGISSVIAMVAIGQGAQQSVQSSIQSIGANLIMVMPGAQRGPGVQVSAGRGSARTLTQADADAIASEITQVSAVAPEVSSRYQVTSKGKNTNTSVVGVTPEYATVRNVAVAEGSFIVDQHLRSASKIAVLGPTVATDLFGEGESAVGQIIRISGSQFTVVGVTTAKGGTGFGSQDDTIYVPLTSAQRYLAGDDYVTSISLQAIDEAAMVSVQQQVTDLLLTRHHISNPLLADFSILNQADIVATASSVTQTFTALLAAVAGISLLVGGIGIMNMMLTTVTERTREIGLRKALGAKRRDINQQFLVEAITLTFLGGLIGVALGWLVSYGLAYFDVLQTSVSAGSVALAFGVATAIGTVFGYYPARRASRLNPIDALRYE